MYATEEELNQAHKDRVAEAAFAVGGDVNAIPTDVMTDLQEQTRQDWIAFKAAQDAPTESPKPRKPSKESIMLGVLNFHVGQQVSRAMLIGASGATKAQVQAFIDAHDGRGNGNEGSEHLLEEVTPNRWKVLVASEGSIDVPPMQYAEDAQGELREVEEVQLPEPVES